MISNYELFSIYDLYLLNNQELGFYITNAFPRTYAQVMDYGRYYGHSWVRVVPGSLSSEQARKRNLAYRVDRYEFGTNRLISRGLLLYDTDKGWSRYQPDL